VPVCPYGAISIKEGRSTLSREDCINCGRCATACPSKAREISGRVMTVDEVMSVLRKDSLFYENSGGGITFGGGEPTSGGQFFLDMAEAALYEGWHVALDTCGYCPEDSFAKALKVVDLLLFDCKHMDPEAHKKLTGVDNTLILNNMRTALTSGREVRIRMPLMPGLNDSEENIAAMADFFLPFGRSEIDIMPCHAFGRNKYVALDKDLPTVRQYSPEELKAVQERFARHGLSTIIA